MAQSLRHQSNRPYQPQLQKHPKGAKPVMAATATATAAVASPVKAAAPMANPVAMAVDPAVKAVDPAVKAVVTDAIAVVDAADAVETVNAKVALNASVLTPKANRCRWTPACRQVAKPNKALMPIARIHVRSARPVNGVSAVAVAAVVASALKMASATSQFVPKDATSPRPTAVQTTRPATRVVSPARHVAKAAMEDEVVAMAVVLAQKAKHHATQTVKTPSKPHRALRKQTRPLLPCP